MINKQNINRGQILIIIVMVTVVGLTIALSLISRTVTDIRMSSQIEQSNKAFSAAEAGVESALKSGQLQPDDPQKTYSVNLSIPTSNENVKATYNISTFGGGGSDEVIKFPLTSPGNNQTLWLAEHNNTGQIIETGTYPLNNNPIDICWNRDAAIIMTLFYIIETGGVTEYKIAKAGYDRPLPIRTPVDNRFLQADDSADSGNFCGLTGYRYKVTVNENSNFFRETSLVLPGGVKLIMLRLQPVYNSTEIAVKAQSATPLPVQGKRITSVGTTDTGVVRKIEVNEGFYTLPGIFDFTLFAKDN